MLQRLLTTIQDIDKTCQEIPVNLIREKTNCQPEMLKKCLEQLEDLAFLTIERGWISLTEMGRRNNLP
jgi:Mn-dependent DtxR family transcriptional regulator